MNTPCAPRRQGGGRAVHQLERLPAPLRSGAGDARAPPAEGAGGDCSGGQPPEEQLGSPALPQGQQQGVRCPPPHQPWPGGTPARHARCATTCTLRSRCGHQLIMHIAPTATTPRLPPARAAPGRVRASAPSTSYAAPGHPNLQLQLGPDWKQQQQQQQQQQLPNADAMLCSSAHAPACNSVTIANIGMPGRNRASRLHCASLSSVTWKACEWPSPMRPQNDMRAIPIKECEGCPPCAP
jgi:hypothetical protein